MPRKNHWWNITDLICPTGITTHDIPYQDEEETFQVILNFLLHRVEVCTSKKELETFSLHDGLSVADFYKNLFNIFKTLKINDKRTIYWLIGRKEGIKNRRLKNAAAGQLVILS